MLVDEFDREVSGVCVSLTDRCNFDCVYCHNEGLGDTRDPMAPREHEMSADDEYLDGNAGGDVAVAAADVDDDTDADDGAEDAPGDTGDPGVAD